MRYQFIQEHQGQFQMTVLLGVAGVSGSAFYQWQKRPMSQRAQHKKKLVTHIRALFQENQGRYGSPRIHRELQASRVTGIESYRHRELQALGIECSQKRVARLMREQNLVVRPTRRFVATTDSAHALPVAQNLLNREYQVEAVAGVNRAWAGDITYIPTAQGWLYVAGCPLGGYWT